MHHETDKEDNEEVVSEPEDLEEGTSHYLDRGGHHQEEAQIDYNSR